MITDLFIGERFRFLVQNCVTDLLIGEIRAVTERGEKVLVTTMTKKMAEDLTDYLSTHGIWEEGMTSAQLLDLIK